MHRYEELLPAYFDALGSSLDKLSAHNEGELSKISAWAYTKRNIIIGITEDTRGVVFRIAPERTLSNDIVEIRKIRSRDDIDTLTGPMRLGGSMPNDMADGALFQAGDLLIMTDNPLAVPAINDQSITGWGRSDGFEKAFTVEDAKIRALNLWNNRNDKKPSQNSYVFNTSQVITTLESIIKRKFFLERRIHRYIRDHAQTVLPSYKRCLFEHVLKNGAEMRKADFILEREQGLPPLLIELESPVHKVLTQKLELTAQANHARNQIAEWTQFIDSNAPENASGEFSFLTGTKEKLVIIGAGLENRETLINQKFSGTTFWTYDLLIEEMKHRLNEAYIAQCKLIGLEAKRPF